MSRKHYECCSYQPCYYGGSNYGTKGGSFGLVGITVLILIILQFTKKGCCKDHKDRYECDEEYDEYDKECEEEYDEYDEEDDKECEEEYDEEYDEEYCDSEEKDYKERKKDCSPLVDNGILFIIALFYLSCCGKRCC
jgi:hypothetical protein